MNDIIMLVFTGVIAISTVCYTIFSSRLWKTTQASVDLARYSEFLNLMLMLGKHVDDAKKQGAPETEKLQELLNIIGEFGFKRFLDDVDFNKDKLAMEYDENLEEFFLNNNIDPNSIPFFRPIFNKLYDYRKKK